MQSVRRCSLGATHQTQTPRNAVQGGVLTCQTRSASRSADRQDTPRKKMSRCPGSAARLPGGAWSAAGAAAEWRATNQRVLRGREEMAAWRVACNTDNRGCARVEGQACKEPAWRGVPAGRQSSQMRVAMGLQLQPMPLQAMLQLLSWHIGEATDGRQVAVTQQVGRRGRRGGAGSSRRVADVRSDPLPGSGCGATGRGMTQGAQGATGCGGRKQGTVGRYARRRRNPR